MLLAAVMAILGVKMAAQDSLGDVARRIRAAKGEDAPSATDKAATDEYGGKAASVADYGGFERNRGTFGGEG